MILNCLTIKLTKYQVTKVAAKEAITCFKLFANGVIPSTGEIAGLVENHNELRRLFQLLFLKTLPKKQKTKIVRSKQHFKLQFVNHGLL